jgi:hypothetical protein
VKGCKILAYTQSSRPLSRVISLSWHTCCDTGPRIFRSHPKNQPQFSRLLLQTRYCERSILNLILTCPYSVASYHKQRDAEDLFLPWSSRVTVFVVLFLNKKVFFNTRLSIS